MAEFLLELLCEEIPARMQRKAASDLKTAFETQLKQHQLGFATVETWITPRRMVAVIQGLDEATQEKQEERRGPRIGAPESAIQGFLKSVGVTQDGCEQREGYWYANLHVPARAAGVILPEIINAILNQFNWPKSMRWAGADQVWVRPLRSILATLDGNPFVFEVNRLGLTSGTQTRGHRALSPGTFEVKDYKDYLAKLQQAYVVLDHDTRQNLIVEGLQKLGRDHGYHLESDPKLLEEVAGLVEFPQPLIGKIDDQFMGLPKSVLTTSMRVHQKYFTFVDDQGKIAPIFGLVANTQPTDGGKEMLVGYERVLRARLSDARFFYEQDQNTKLAQLATKLNTIIFHAKLGTLAQRVERLGQLVSSPAAKRAASLAKADLVTQMVGEFPELQGIMGEIYAILEGEIPEVAQAIREHYLPQGPNDHLPETEAGIELAIAEKVDALVGFFLIGEEPTGSKDPYALRRMALGLIRIIREKNLKDLNIQTLFEKAIRLYQDQGIKSGLDFRLDRLVSFIFERLEHALKAEGMRVDAIRAVLKAQSQQVNIWSIAERVIALNALLQTGVGGALQQAFGRAYGILGTREKSAVIPERFVAESERILYEKLQQIAEHAPKLLAKHDYQGLMQQLASLKQPLDHFFELKVNDDNPDIRENRLALLQALVHQTLVIADLTQLEGN
jgi:glycyl-tRNA synthetase beta chain